MNEAVGSQRDCQMELARARFADGNIAGGELAVGEPEPAALGDRSGGGN